MSLKNSMFRVKVVHFLSNNRNNPLIKFFNKIASYYTKAYNNVSYNSIYNGEVNVFKVLSQHNCKNFIECGANDGVDANEYSKISPSTTVWALEIVPSTFGVLKKATKDNQQIKCFNIGLDKEDGTVNITHYPEASYLSSTYSTSKEFKKETIPCKVVKGDNFCKENKLDHIDFLKIDVEGMDFEVIKGFEEMINSESVDVIQFEYTYGFIYARNFLKDVYDFFADKNYVIGKIYANKVDFLDYSHELENFYDANYIIVNKNKVNLIKDLGRLK